MSSRISRVLTAVIAPLVAMLGVAATVGAQSLGQSSSSSMSSSTMSSYSMMHSMSSVGGDAMMSSSAFSFPAYSSSFPQSSSSYSVMSSAPPVQIYDNSVQPLTFKDVPDDAWYKEFVDQSSRAGIVNGYKDPDGNLTGFFGPNDKLSVGQAAKIALQSAGYGVSEMEQVIIAQDQHWATPYLNKARELNFQFMQSGVVSPDEPASRAMVASMFTDSFRVAVSTEIMGAKFRDLGPQIIFAQSVDSLSRDGIISGDTDVNGNPTGIVRPKDTIVRAEAVKMAVLARARYGLPGSGVPAQLPDAGFPPAVSSQGFSSYSSSVMSSLPAYSSSYPMMSSSSPFYYSSAMSSSTPVSGSPSYMSSSYSSYNSSVVPYGLMDYSSSQGYVSSSVGSAGAQSSAYDMHAGHDHSAMTQ